jgi:hypothetical protein
MAEKMVRCVRCHYVFDAEQGPCIKCGTPYKEPPPLAPQPEATYSEIYASEMPPSEPFVSAAPPVRRKNTTYLIFGGIGLMGTAVVVALLFDIGFGGGAGATPPPRVVLAAPTPVRTLPPTVATTLAQLNNPNFNAHLTIHSAINVTATVAKPQIIHISYDGIISSGNQWGTLQVNSSTQQVMVADGQAFVRTPPSTKWTSSASYPSYRVVVPLFGIKDENSLAMIGQDTRQGLVLNHLQATHWWTPDLSRLALYDMSFVPRGLYPDTMSLDIWTKADGTPMTATFTAQTSAGNSPILSIDVDYTFTDVGSFKYITPPGPAWTESPGPQPTT